MTKPSLWPVPILSITGRISGISRRWGRTCVPAYGNRRGRQTHLGAGCGGSSGISPDVRRDHLRDRSDRGCARSLTGKIRVEQIHYSQSADITGETGHMVSYAAIGLYEPRRIRIPPTDRSILLSIAKRALDCAARRMPARRVEPSDPHAPLLENGAAFVTLRKSGDLRGCIGTLGRDKPLAAVRVRGRCA